MQGLSEKFFCGKEAQATHSTETPSLLMLQHARKYADDCSLSHIGDSVHPGTKTMNASAALPLPLLPLGVTPSACLLSLFFSSSSSLTETASIISDINGGLT
jgi:hypothetical protein